MSVIEEIRRNREKLAEVLKEHPGIRKVVEDLYPGTTHFIFELLQNAEDTHASEVRFTLSESKLVFEHDGRPFNEADISAITDIGEGTKEGDDDTIGRFGIGFKAVFAYTETPRIWSPTFSFQISELVLPDEIQADPTLGQKTRFEFPFNSEKKAKSDAFEEVRTRLNQISESTLLFLSSIESIHWQVGGGNEGRVLRIAHSENHIEALKEENNLETSSSHFLRFTSPIEELSSQRIAIAFVLEPIPAAKKIDTSKPLAKQFSIVPATPGEVAVFFTAEKETSGLRFHLHAPFVPELSRASVKDTPANETLFRQLAKLSAESLPVIRDLGFLKADFLAVLPNADDDVGHPYECIRHAIVNAMNEEPLTPTHAKSHAPAKHLFQAKASLKSLLPPEDLEFLVGELEQPAAWAIGATQKNSAVDRFLSDLAITGWEVEQFLEVMEEKLGNEDWYDDENDEWMEGPERALVDWLRSKSDEWHQSLYALLYRELEPADELYRLDDLHIVRLSSGEYGVGRKCFFPTEESHDDTVLPRVAMATYTSGKSKTDQRNARKLLEAIGVREVGEREQVEAILEERYSWEGETPSDNVHRSDVRRFIALVEAHSDDAPLFEEYWIFEGQNEEWYQPRHLYLDTPYIETGLHSYYKCLGDDADRDALSKKYEKLGVSHKKLVRFAQRVGVASQVEVVESKCSANPCWDYLEDVGGGRSAYAIDTDYVIPGLEKFLSESTVNTSLIVWNTLRDLPAEPNRLLATYQRTKSGGSRTADSQLVCQLKGAEWVPQGKKLFVRPAEALREQLPDGFAFDPGWAWIKAIGFGEASAKQVEEDRKRREVAKELGFQNDEALSDATWFAGLSAEDRQRFKTEYERIRTADLPDRGPSDPDRRAAKVSEQASDAPQRTVETRERSVSVNRESVKKDAQPYLRQQYTNDDGVMICQVCKAELPFKVADESYFFETTEFLPELKKHYYQNYLALCPNHAAMYQYANDTKDLVTGMFMELTGNELEIVLASRDSKIYFTATHMLDLQAIIRTDEGD